VSFSILINNSQQAHFSPTNGIRQGDPLSPLTFILCFDILGDTVLEYRNLGLIKGVKYRGVEEEQTRVIC